MILGVGGGGFWGLLFLGILEEVCWGIGNLRFGMGHGFGIWFFGFWMAGCVWEGVRLGCVLQAWEMNFQIGFARLFGREIAAFVFLVQFALEIGLVARRRRQNGIDAAELVERFGGGVIERIEVGILQKVVAFRKRQLGIGQRQLVVVGKQIEVRHAEHVLVHHDKVHHPLGV